LPICGLGEHPDELAADGFSVSIRTPAGHRYSADQFKHLLTSKSLDAQGIADDG
jgi:hypothetical protein